MALRQEMHEDQKRLGFEGTDDACQVQFPAVDIEGAFAKHKEHGTSGRARPTGLAQSGHSNSSGTP
jgi:hypothetical protein